MIHSDEQQMAEITITPAELNDLSLASMKLWSLDVNRFVPGKDYKINLQQSKVIFKPNDVAPYPLFIGVEKNKFFSLPTFKLFYNLLDNYQHIIGKAEVVPKEEENESWQLINAIISTPCMKYCYQYLLAKKRIPAGLDKFKQQLYDLWFKMYSRLSNNILDSSGFEHVFVGEYKNGKVSGLHNWIQIFLEESKGRLDYQGFICPKKKNQENIIPTETDQLITIQFTWDVDPNNKDKKKDVSSTFVGSSPEFEFALYTLCFLVDKEEDHFIEVGTHDHIYRVNIKCYRWTTKEKNIELIASCFPVARD